MFLLTFLFSDVTVFLFSLLWPNICFWKNLKGGRHRNTVHRGQEGMGVGISWSMMPTKKYGNGNAIPQLGVFFPPFYHSRILPMEQCCSTQSGTLLLRWTSLDTASQTPKGLLHKRPQVFNSVKLAEEINHHRGFGNFWHDLLHIVSIMDPIVS